jgi:hypothetical protein
LTQLGQNAGLLQPKCKRNPSGGDFRERQSKKYCAPQDQVRTDQRANQPHDQRAKERWEKEI